MLRMWNRNKLNVKFAHINNMDPILGHEYTGVSETLIISENRARKFHVRATNRKCVKHLKKPK